VGVPGPPGADLVVVEPGFVLRGLEALLDGPAGAGDPDQLAQRGGFYRMLQLIVGTPGGCWLTSSGLAASE
jgi:hypothetical protein